MRKLCPLCWIRLNIHPNTIQSYGTYIAFGVKSILNLANHKHRDSYIKYESIKITYSYNIFVHPRKMFIIGTRVDDLFIITSLNNSLL